MKSSELKPVRWIHGEIKSPPFSLKARKEAGVLIMYLQSGEKLSMPQSRPMPSIGAGVHELRVKDTGHNWRVIYRMDSDFVLIVEVFAKKTQQTPQTVVDNCKSRLAEYDRIRAP